MSIVTFLIIFFFVGCGLIVSFAVGLYVDQEDNKAELSDTWLKAVDSTQTIAREPSPHSMETVMGCSTQMTECQCNNVWYDADGNYLPGFDREVIALTGDEDDLDQVVFAHRPAPDGHAITYGNGGWDIPDVKYWLDANLPTDKD